MATAKQSESIFMGAFIRTGGTPKPFVVNGTPYPISFDVWNVNIDEQADYLGSPNTQTISGFERGNPMGYRTYADIDLNNSYPASSSSIRTLLNFFSSQFNRPFFTTTIQSVDGVNKTLTIVGGVTTTNYYNGLIIRNTSVSNQTRRIVSYSNTGVAVLDSPFSGWSDTNNIVIEVPPSIPTIMGITTDSTSQTIDNLLYFNLDSSVFGITRELTVGSQVISISLRGIDRKISIADNVRIGT
jgi:hypothetical protein